MINFDTIHLAVTDTDSLLHFPLTALPEILCAVDIYIYFLPRRAKNSTLISTMIAFKA